MGVRPNHFVSIQEQAISADGVYAFDLGVNPLSVIMLGLRPLNETSTLGNFARYLSICDALNRVSIIHRGQTVLSMTGRDIAVMNYLRHNILPREANPDDADNERRCVVLPVLLGRNAYDVTSCFPASRRGELVMELDIDIADTGYDGFRLSAETVELIGATPSEFERKLSTSQTFASVSNQVVPLPLGNVVRGALCYGTTDFTGSAPAPSWGRTSLFLDNQQYFLSASDFEMMVAANSLMGRQSPVLDAHTHRVPTNSGANEETTGPIEQGATFGNYMFLDFDPTRDDAFSVDATKAASLYLGVSNETADAVRVVTVERMSV